MAQLKNTTISDTGFLQLPVGTTAQRPSPAAGQMRFNTNAGKAEFYNAATAAWVGTAATGVIATGGVVYDVDVEGTTYRVHVFTSTGNSTFAVTRGGPVEYLIVAGGGQGGADNGGAGGGGGVLTGVTNVTPQSYTITVGAGAAVNNNNNQDNHSNGGNSLAFGLTANGGGFGASGNAGLRAPGRGGTGGGGEGETQITSQQTGATPIVSGQGFAGGNGSSGGGGGGGGSAGPGQNASGTVGGNGGIGISSTINGIAVRYGAGGGGGSENSGVGGGSGGGGLGGIGGNPSSGGGTNTSFGGDATPNTGGGGGGSSSTGSRGGHGGSGIVIVRYPLRQENPVTAAGKVVGDGVVLDLDFAKPTVYTGSGTVVNDSRLNGITGTLINSPVFADPRTHRSNFTFNGVDNVIQFTGSNLVDRGLISNRPFSIVFWGLVDGSYPSSLNFFNNIHPEISGAVAVQIFYDPSTGNLAYATRAADLGYVQITSAINLNQWYHICATREASGNWRAYLNGAIVGTIASVRTDFGNITDGIFLGRRSGTTFPLGGKIGFYQFYDQRLTDSQVAQQYNATRWRFGV